MSLIFLFKCHTFVLYTPEGETKSIYQSLFGHPFLLVKVAVHEHYGKDFKKNHADTVSVGSEMTNQ